MTYKYNIPVLNNFYQIKSIQGETEDAYFKGILNYVMFFNKDIEKIYRKQVTTKDFKEKAKLIGEFEERMNQFLINEIEESKKQIKDHHNVIYETQLYKKLGQYQSFLYNSYSKNTAVNYYGKMHSFCETLITGYKINKPLKPQNRTLNAHPLDEDIPTKEMIREVVNNKKNKKSKAIIIFMASSGTSGKETRELTINDFLIATEEYHKMPINNENAYNILKKLETRNNGKFDIIPTFQYIRHKTQKFYYGFCTPEAVKYILDYLINEEYLEKEIKITDKLFGGISKDNMNYLYYSANDKFNYGKGHDGKNKFRSHNMRRTQIREASKGETNKENIIRFFDKIQGRNQPNVYTTINPNDEKETCKKYLHKLTYMEDIDPKEKKNKISDEKYQELKSEIAIKNKTNDSLITENSRLKTERDVFKKESEEKEDKLKKMENNNQYLTYSLKLSNELNNIHIKGL